MSPLKLKLQQVTEELNQRWQDKLDLLQARFDEERRIRKEAGRIAQRRIASLIDENIKLIRAQEDLDEELDKV